MVDVLILVSQVVLYLIIACVFRQMQRKYRSRELNQALLSRFKKYQANIVSTLQLGDVCVIYAKEETLRCRVCAFANTQRVKSCVICEAKLKLTPFERAFRKPPLTARQLRARQRTEWQRQLDFCGQVYWHRKVEGCAQYAGLIPVFEENSADRETEMNVVLSEGKPGSIITKLQNETKNLRIKTVPAESANALEFAIGRSNSNNVDVEGLLELASKDFPTKFAYFVTCTSSLIIPAELDMLKLFLRREHVLEESMEYFCCMNDDDIRSVVRIDFAAENGIDAGGVHREWFALVMQLITDPSLAILTCTNRGAQTYFFNADSRHLIDEEHLAYYFALGRLVGRALLEGEVMNFHFVPALLKLILGIPITFLDYEDLDPMTFKSLKWMLEHDGAETLELEFLTTKKDSFGSSITVELVPNGANIPVTDDNKHSFTERWLHYHLLESVSDQLNVFLKGLYQVIPRHLFMLFDAEELDYILCGCDVIDVMDWQTHTKYSNLAGTQIPQWFWEIVHSMSPTYQKRLLQFSTGCSRVPLSSYRRFPALDKSGRTKQSIHTKWS